MLTEDITNIQTALIKCFQRRIPDSDEEVAAAETKLEYLQLRRGKVFLEANSNIL